MTKLHPYVAASPLPGGVCFAWAHAAAAPGSDGSPGPAATTRERQGPQGTMDEDGKHSIDPKKHDINIYKL